METGEHTGTVVPGGRPGIILATSNGTGMGHLVRQIAVGTMLNGSVEPLIFSMSPALPLIAEHGLRGEYCPSHQRGWMPHPLWHGYLRDRVSALLAETGARTFVFDGVSPYLGLLRARADHPDVAFCWVRRGMWQRRANERALAAAPFFDLIVEPGDVSTDADVGLTTKLDDAIKLDPITMLEPSQLLTRKEAAAELGLDDSRPTALVALGAGAINDTRTPALAAIEAILADSDWQIAVTKAPLAARGLDASRASRLHELENVYPLARYMNAFDAAVSAAGYNAVHELLLAQVPSVLVPNRSTSTDDQVSRARWAANVGLALYAEADADSVGTAAAQLLDPLVRDRLHEICGTLPRATGASTLANLLLTLSSTFDSHHPSVNERVRAQDLALRDAAMRGLGPSGTSLVRKALGRSLPGGPTHRLEIEPIVSDQLDAKLLRGQHPVEHLLPGSSQAYRDRRLEIAHRCYRWPSQE